MALFAKQTTPNVPVFDITAEGESVGTITNLPNEGVAWTINVLDVVTTSYDATTIHGALAAARAAYLEIMAGTHWVQTMDEQDEDFIEDEDGEMAYMIMMERRAESHWDADQEPHY